MALSAVLFGANVPAPPLQIPPVPPTTEPAREMVDALAQGSGLPLVQLLGGKARPIRAYNSLGMVSAKNAAEVAGLCVYLLSDESAFVTGAEFVIDGGLTAR